MTSQRDELEDLLDDLAASGPPHADRLPAALEARILADAESVLAQRPSPRGFWAAVSDLIGGWPAAAGLAAAGLCGVWIGVAPPEGALALMSSDAETVDLLGVSTLFAEEAVDG